MPSAEAVPDAPATLAVFSLTRVDESIGLSLREDAGPLDLGCVHLPTLDLDAVELKRTDADLAPAQALDATKTRRLTLRRATVATNPQRLQAALEQLHLSASGFRDVRVWFEADGPWLAGRVMVDEKEAPFTIRVALEARADARRRLRVFLGDVRLYAPLTIPAPQVGALLATAIVTAWTDGGSALRASGASLDLAPLELALPRAMVAGGWRLPNLNAAGLESIEKRDDELRLGFGSERRSTERVTPLDPAPDQGSGTGPAAWIEGERVPDALAAADEKLYAGDLAGAEADYRRFLAEDDINGARAARARLAALRLAAGAPDTGPRGMDMTRRWPAFVPGWLTAALAAVQNDEHAAAASFFEEAAALATARNEPTDARLATQAAVAAHAAAPAKAAAPEAVVTSDEATPEAAVKHRPSEKAAPEAEAAQPSADDVGTAAEETPSAAKAADAPADDVGAAAEETPSATKAADAPVDDVSAAASPAPLTAEADLAAQTPAEASAPVAEARAAAGPAEEAPFSEVTVTRLTHGKAPLAEPTAEALAIPRATDRSDTGNITSQTKAVYAAETDPEARAGALGDLLKGFDSLPPERQRAAYASFGRVAESTGDLAHAEEAYWRGTNLDGRPEQTVDLLLAHARLLLSRGSDRAAVVDLEEALKLAPSNPHAVAARADLAFRERDWTRARDLYAKLERLGTPAEAVARETLLHRRAVLARAAGDDDEAEACFRELTALDPRQIEARQALSDIAFQRGDLETAAQYLDEALRLLPLDALEALLELRSKLGDIHIGLGDWNAARHDLELVLDQDPGRVSTLEHLADVYERLELFDEAARTCEQLSRLYRQSGRRAQALFRRGEILLDRLGDEARAFDSFLKASDLDPTFVPTALRLVSGFWRRGSFEDVAELADELEKLHDLGGLPLPARLRLAVSLALTRGGAVHGLAVIDRDDLGGDPSEALSALTEAAEHLAKRSSDELEPVVALYGALGAEDAARSALARS